MMATFSWAPLKNSGFRSIGMSCAALLVVIDSHIRPESTAQYFRGSSVICDPKRSNSLPAGHTADVTETSKYSRFQANKKTCAFACVTAYSREVAVSSGTVENRAWLHGSRPLPRGILNTMTITILLLGLVGGVLVGLLGIGGGV